MFFKLPLQGAFKWIRLSDPRALPLGWINAGPSARCYCQRSLVSKATNRSRTCGRARRSQRTNKKKMTTISSP